METSKLEDVLINKKILQDCLKVCHDIKFVDYLRGDDAEEELIIQTFGGGYQTLFNLFRLYKQIFDEKVNHYEPEIKKKVKLDSPHLCETLVIKEQFSCILLLILGVLAHYIYETERITFGFSIVIR